MLLPGRNSNIHLLTTEFKHSPTIAHATLAKELETLKLPQEVTVVQYIDDVFVGGHSAEPVKQAMDIIITHSQLG